MLGCLTSLITEISLLILLEFEQKIEQREIVLIERVVPVQDYSAFCLYRLTNTTTEEHKGCYNKLTT